MLDLIKETESANRIAITGHVHPDGDCIGSCLGMYNFITKKFPEKEVDIYLEGIQSCFNFMPNSDKIKHPSKAKKAKSYDVFIVLDCGDEGRIGVLIDTFKKAKHTICIDHHLSNNSFAKTNYVVADASSTCELVGNVIEFIDKDIAECLYTGLVHDTGVFQYSATSGDTMRFAARLMETGIDFPWIITHTFYEKTFAQNRIMGVALLNARLMDEGRIVLSTLMDKELKENGVTTADLEGIVEQLRVTKEAEISVFIYEREDGIFKASTRTKSDTDLSKVAVSFGGGGHAKAAGFNFKGTLDEYIPKIIDKIIQVRESSC